MSLAERLMDRHVAKARGDVAEARALDAIMDARIQLAPVDPVQLVPDTLVVSKDSVVRGGQLSGGPFDGSRAVVKEGGGEKSFIVLRGELADPELQIAIGFDDVRKAVAETGGALATEPIAVIPASSEDVLALVGLDPQGTARAVKVFCSALAKARAQRDYEPQLIKPGTAHTCKTLTGLEKVEPDEAGDLRLITGVVLEPEVADAQDDIYSEDEIRKTAHLWMIDFQNLGLQHKATVNHQVSPVESWIAPQDLKIEGEKVTKGTWLLTVKVFDDDMWDSIKKGELTGFSIEGWARKTPVQSDGVNSS